MLSLLRTLGSACRGVSAYRLTDRGLCGLRPLHAGAVVGHVFIRAGAHWSTGAEQTQPLTLLPVAWVRHWHSKIKMAKWG